ncbi:MAG: DNA repair protein RecO [Patescibacteria group bacterium]
MIRTYKVNAIVLARRNIGEADKLITLFTKEYGKKKVLAKGIRRVSSRRAPYLEQFSYIQALIRVGKTLDYLTEVSPLGTFSFIRQRLERIGFAYIVSELTDRLTAENQEAEVIFDDLVAFMERLNQKEMQRSEAQQLTILFKKNILTTLGFIGRNFSMHEIDLDRQIESILERKMMSPLLLASIQLK